MNLLNLPELVQRQGRGYSFEAIRAKMLYSPTLQKQPQHRPRRYGADFPGRAIPSQVEPPGALGTDIDALLAVLEREQQESQKSTQ